MPLPRLVTRTLVSIGALSGLGRRVRRSARRTAPAPAAPAPTDAPWPRRLRRQPGGVHRQRPVAGRLLRRAARLVRRARRRPGRSLRLGTASGLRRGRGRSRDGCRLVVRRLGAPSRPSATAAPLAPAPVRSTNGETGTNVQEAGVDEPDVVKTDGRTLFRVEDGDLVTYDVTGAEVERLGLARPARRRRDGHRDPALRRDRGRDLSHRRRRRRRRRRRPSGHRRRLRPVRAGGRPTPSPTTAAWSPRGCTTAWSGSCSRPACPTSTSTEPGKHTTDSGGHARPTRRSSARPTIERLAADGVVPTTATARAAARLRPGRDPRRRRPRSAPSRSSASTPPAPRAPR